MSRSSRTVQRSGPHGSWKAKSTAAKVKGVKDSPVEQPTVLILGATTPDEFYKGLTTASTSNGLLNRLVVIAISDRPEMQDVAAIPAVPKQLSDDIKAALEGFPKPGGGAFKGVALADASMQAAMHAIPYADDAAKERFRQVQRDQRKMLEFKFDLAGIVERVAENAIKLATLRAISTDPVNPAVTVGDIEWGWALIHRSIDSVNQGVARYMAGSNAEALRKLVYGHIQDAGGRRNPEILAHEKERGAEGDAVRTRRRSSMAGTVGPDCERWQGRSARRSWPVRRKVCCHPIHAGRRVTCCKRLCNRSRFLQ